MGLPISVRFPERPNRAEASCRLVLVAVGLVVSLATSSFGETVVLEPSRDATLIESDDGSLANGSGPALFVGRTSQRLNSRRRALIAFDPASWIPDGAWIRSVSLELVLTSSNSSEIDVGLHRVLSPWSEGPAFSSGGRGAPSDVGDVTWIHGSYPSLEWSTPGGDLAASPSSVATVEVAGAYVWTSTPELVEDVRSWLEFPESNHGWALVGGEGASSTSKRFASREHPEVDARPLLIVEYETSCREAPIPRRLLGPCRAYCEALECASAEPRGSRRACERLAERVRRIAPLSALPCEVMDSRE